MKPPVLLSVLLILPAVIVAPAAEPGVLTPESAVARALSHNPDLAAARTAIDAARARLQQAGRWSNPELELEVLPNLRGREGSLTAGLTQQFPVTRRLSLAKAVSRAQLLAAEAEVRDAERRLATDVRIQITQLTALQELSRLQEAQLANSRDLAAHLARAASVGEATSLEAAQLSLESSRLELALLQSRHETATATEGLRALLDLPEPDPVRVEETLPAPTNAPAGPAPMDTSPRPDYAATLAQVDAARNDVELARRTRWQDIGVGLFGELDRSEDQPFGIEDEASVGVRITVPLPLWDRGQGRIAEAAAALDRAEKLARATAARIRAEARLAESQMRTARESWRHLTEKLLPGAQQLETRSLALSREGQMPLPEALRARDRRLELEAAALAARRDFHLARIRLESALGATPSPVQTPAP